MVDSGLGAILILSYLTLLAFSVADLFASIIMVVKRTAMKSRDTTTKFLVTLFLFVASFTIAYLADIENSMLHYGTVAAISCSFFLQFIDFVKRHSA